MHSNNGPPARITRATARRAREQARESQGPPPQEGPKESSDVPARPQIAAPREESILMLIAESTSDHREPSEAERNAPSEQEIIRERAENTIEQEQSYTTAPTSLRISADPAVIGAFPYHASTSKGKGHEIPSPSYSEEHSSSQRRSTTSRSTCNEEKKQLGLLLTEWIDHSERNMEESCRATEESCRATEESRRATEESRKASEALRDIQQMVEHIFAQDNEQDASIESTRAKASRALYAECGSNEGTAEYECRQSARARFEVPQYLGRPRVEEEDHTSLSELRNKDRTGCTWKYTARMAESQACAGWTRPHGWTSSPPTLLIREEDKDSNSDEEPSSPDSDDSRADNATI